MKALLYTLILLAFAWWFNRHGEETHALICAVGGLVILGLCKLK